MSTKACGLTCLALLALLSVPTGSFAANLHTESATCRRQYPDTNMSPDCWQVCIQCHQASQPVESFDIYVTGDADLCERCHPAKTDRATNNVLLRIGGDVGGDHPVDIPYDPLRSRTPLQESPSGPLLFVDRNGLFPKVHCSSCHDSMSDTPGLLRVSRPELCISCHRL